MERMLCSAWKSLIRVPLSSLQGVVSPQLEGVLLSSAASLYLFSTNSSFTSVCHILNKTTFPKLKVQWL